MKTIKSQLVTKIFNELDSMGVDYVTLRGFELIPDKISIKRDVDLLVHPDSVSAANKIFIDNGFVIIQTPGEPANTIYLYDAVPSIFFIHNTLDIAFHLVQELSYRSLNKGEIVPVDKELQTSIFENKRYVDEIWKYAPSFEDEMLMLICRCIYDKKTVSLPYKAKIEKLFGVISPEKLHKYCKLVFQKFTFLLLSLVENKKTEYIVEKYNTFCDY